MYIIFVVALLWGLPVGLFWTLSAIAWGRIRRPVAFPQDGQASGEWPRFDCNRQETIDKKPKDRRPVLARIDT
jgi:hypothetical protein